MSQDIGSCLDGVSAATPAPPPVGRSCSAIYILDLAALGNESFMGEEKINIFSNKSIILIFITINTLNYVFLFKVFIVINISKYYVKLSKNHMLTLPDPTSTPNFL